MYEFICALPEMLPPLGAVATFFIMFFLQCILKRRWIQIAASEQEMAIGIGIVVFSFIVFAIIGLAIGKTMSCF